MQKHPRGRCVDAFRVTEVPNERFVLVWESSCCLNEVSERTGIAKTYCSLRASKLRGVGVNLKSFRGGASAIDPDALNAIVASVRKGKVKTTSKKRSPKASLPTTSKASTPKRRPSPSVRQPANGIVHSHRKGAAE